LKLVSAESSLLNIIKRLEGELNVFKKAYTEVSSEKTLLEEQYEQLKRDAEKQKKQFEQRPQVNSALPQCISC